MALPEILDENIYDITLKIAQECVNKCSGDNAIDLSTITPDNMESLRYTFISEVRYLGGDAHGDIIVVLVYMSYFTID